MVKSIVKGVLSDYDDATKVITLTLDDGTTVTTTTHRIEFLVVIDAV